MAEQKNDTKVTDNNFETPDVQVAAKAGLSEGDVKALRDDAGLNRLPGHSATVGAWAASEQGKEFAKGEKDRNKAAEDGAKAAHESLNKDGLSEADRKYTEAVGK